MKRGADQIALPLDWPQTEGESRFIVTDANRQAFDHFRRWTMWPVRATILTGSAKVGPEPPRQDVRGARGRARDRSGGPWG